MDGDEKWRTLCVGQGNTCPFVVWRVVAGVTVYHRTEWALRR